MMTVKTSEFWIRHTADPQLVELLQVEHDEIERRFAGVVREARRGAWLECHAAWKPFVDLLRRHMQFEDDQLLPAFEMHGPDTRAMGQEIRRQHEDLRWRISKMSARVQERQLMAEEVEALIEAMRGHAEFEDQCFHPWIAKQLGLPPDRARVRD